MPFFYFIQAIFACFFLGHLAARHEYIHFKNGAQIMVHSTPYTHGEVNFMQMSL